MTIDFRVKFLDETKLLEDESKKYFINNLENIISILTTNLDLPEEYMIVIPDDYEKELIEFHLENAISGGFTNHEMGKGYAQAIDYINDNRLMYTIFINKLIIFALQSDYIIDNLEESKDEIIKARKLAINTIHHELIHIADVYKAYTTYDTIIKSNNSDALKDLLIHFALSIWKEYFACRLSASTYHMDFVSDIQSLINQINDVEKNIKETIIEYRLHGDINIVEKELLTRTRILLNNTAYLQGHLFVFHDINEIIKLVKIINEKISESYFTDIWSDMFYELNELFDTYLKWDMVAFNKLSQIILKCWNKLGIFPNEAEQGIYYSIP